MMRGFDINALLLHRLHGIPRERLVEHREHLGRNIVQRNARDPLKGRI